jgi:hypothetical protein
MEGWRGAPKHGIRQANRCVTARLICQTRYGGFATMGGHAQRVNLPILEALRHAHDFLALVWISEHLPNVSLTCVEDVRRASEHCLTRSITETFPGLVGAWAKVCHGAIGDISSVVVTDQGLHLRQALLGNACRYKWLHRRSSDNCRT